MRDLEFATLASVDFYESLSRLEPDPKYKEILETLIPEGWTIKPFDVWLMAQPVPYELIHQGFKIHVSVTRRNAEAMLRIVIPECAKRNMPFKIVAGRRLLSMMNSKNFGRGQSGKFIVIYPRTPDLFKEMIEQLYKLTMGFEGPYILSDRRYKDSKVLYYRYGGFRSTNRLNVDSRKTACIQAPDGRLEPDERLPYFKLPAWISDPFDEAAEEEPDELLAGRYRIEAAITFSNTGGVYTAVDTRTDRKVIVKEARPLTNFWITREEGTEYLDAVAILGREFRMLEKLSDSPWVVKGIDLFQEWEHYFLVEEYVEGVPLTKFRAREDFLVVAHEPTQEKTIRFCEKFRVVAGQVIRIVLDLHSRNILLGDVSTNNFLVDPETLNVVLIDLETAVDLENPEEGDKVVRLWSTPGYRRPGRVEKGELSASDDLYALGMVLYSLLVPIQPFFELEPKAREHFVDDIAWSVGLPPQVKQTIFLLLAGKGEEALQVLESWEPRWSVTRIWRRGETLRLESWQEADRERIADRLREVNPRIASFLMATYDTGRQDRLWPADFDVFNTNPLNVAYGACGPLLFLKETGHSIPGEIQEWILRQDLKLDVYPPGLYWGLAGVALTLGELGLWDKAREALDLAYRSPLRFDKADMFHGAAGWGWAHLWFHRQKGEPAFLDRAHEVGEYLLATAEARGEGCCWRNSLDGNVHFGFAYGASGVSLFLLHLYQASGDPRFLDLARGGLAFEISNAFDPSAPVLKWTNHETAVPICEPYWEHGNAGIGSVFIRFAAALGEAGYRDIAERAEHYAYCKFAVHPNQFSGLSGIGEFMLDLFLGTGKDIYLNKAYAIADTILKYAVERSQGIAFPGRFLLRLSNDFSTGSAGIGLFFDRLLHLKPRRFLDLEMSSGSLPQWTEADLVLSR